MVLVGAAFAAEIYWAAFAARKKRPEISEFNLYPICHTF